MSTSTRTLLARACTGAMVGLLALGAAPALAGSPDYDPQSAVPVSRSLVSPTNAHQARQSLAALGDAALEACGASSFSIREHRDAVQGSRCWRDSMANAVAQADNRFLTAAYTDQPMVTVAMRGASAGDVQQR